METSVRTCVDYTNGLRTDRTNGCITRLFMLLILSFENKSRQRAAIKISLTNCFHLLRKIIAFYVVKFSLVHPSWLYKIKCSHNWLSMDDLNDLSGTKLLQLSIIESNVSLLMIGLEHNVNTEDFIDFFFSILLHRKATTGCSKILSKPN